MVINRERQSRNTEPATAAQGQASAPEISEEAILDVFTPAVVEKIEEIVKTQAKAQAKLSRRFISVWLVFPSVMIMFISMLYYWTISSYVGMIISLSAFYFSSIYILAVFVYIDTGDISEARSVLQMSRPLIQTISTLIQTLSEKFKKKQSR